MKENRRRQIMKAVKGMYPFKPKSFKTSSGFNMNYIDEGEGPALILVHGNPSWSFYWRELVMALRGHRRIIVPDHIGCGLSDRPEANEYGFTLRNRIEDLCDLIKHTGVINEENSTFDMAVHDWGGAIGAGAARRMPEHLNKLVITNTAMFTLPESRPFHKELKFSRSKLGRLLIRKLNAFAVAATMRCTVSPMPKAVKKAYTLPYQGMKYSLATERFVMDIPLHKGDTSWDELKDIEGFIENWKKPVQLLWGLQDFIFDEHFFEEFKKRIPHAEYRSFENAGHYLMEDAGPEVCAEIESFLKEN